jgi:hypothetical protein
LSCHCTGTLSFIATLSLSLICRDRANRTRQAERTQDAGTTTAVFKKVHYRFLAGYDFLVPFPFAGFAGRYFSPKLYWIELTRQKSVYR